MASSEQQPSPAVRITAMASGNGSNFQAILDAAGDSKDPETVAAARAAYDAALAALVLEDAPDLVVLAGWMHVFSEAFLRPLAGAGVKCINLHPALPGRYDGANAIERAFKDFQEGKLESGKTGIMIHYVIAEVDRGEPIMVREIECREGEELAQLEERIHAAEHELIVSATAQVVGEIAASKKAEI
ncbi:phosphoribosylglycinamide formyltransferase [Magnaporthiopsis poae ATCC 64411]|uniref:phosphoribosylglycinamide formyltransferase 1 n=1 Tax=Magnaporthiopsis poae (strain ATCC 64411 / 73-15) TaxID=644358 RepID=A0A0C4DS12_MAGP6|nr:phosphoribosylglycinamide formyltransferase [Magnaporthiopsis poae ATCC 64411]